MRHTFASRLLNVGVSIEDVSKLLGRSSLRMTDEVYGHLCPDRASHMAADALDKIHAPVPTNVVQLRTA